MKAVILAGGLGSRLKPFTDVIPKPLLPLGDRSLLEVQLEHLKGFGVDEVFLALNYKANYLQSYFGDGDKLGIKLHFSVEEKPLGTCGPVSLLREHLTEPFLLMNGDILTRANLKELYDFALGVKDAHLTISTKTITTPFRFGNVFCEGNYVKKVDEKPDLHFDILAGIYVLKPALFEIIPSNEHFGIDDLIHKMLGRGWPISRYKIKEYWLDIGVVEDYNEARKLYSKHFEGDRPVQ